LLKKILFGSKIFFFVYYYYRQFTQVESVGSQVARPSGTPPPSRMQRISINCCCETPSRVRRRPSPCAVLPYSPTHPTPTLPPGPPLPSRRPRSGFSLLRPTQSPHLPAREFPLRRLPPDTALGHVGRRTASFPRPRRWVSPGASRAGSGEIRRLRSVDPLRGAGQQGGLLCFGGCVCACGPVR
jgi:hypothetical protein